MHETEQRRGFSNYYGEKWGTERLKRAFVEDLNRHFNRRGTFAQFCDQRGWNDKFVRNTLTILQIRNRPVYYLAGDSIELVSMKEQMKEEANEE